MRHTTRRNDLMPLAALYAVSLVPGAQAYCYRDVYGVQHCSISTGVRIGIAIAAIVGFLVVLMALRTAQRRRTRAANMSYVNTSVVAGAVPPPGYPPQGVPPGFAPQGGPPGFPPQGGPPGFPPQGGYPGFAPQGGPPGVPPPGGPPGFQPPQGPPPGSPPQPVYRPDSYFPYPQSGPAQYANTPNPDPAHTPPQYPPQSYDAQAPYAAVRFHFSVVLHSSC
ncbi:hypothetical protein V8D89_004777 [Ganoderma adspersum]